MTTFAVPSIPRPSLRGRFTDPTFGTQITRITGPAMSPADSSGPCLGLIHEYARFPGLSSDNQKIVVQVIGGQYRGAWEIRDITTGALLHRFALQGDPEFSWDRLNLNRLFYRTGNEIHTYHVARQQDDTWMVFPQYDTIGTGEEGRPSDDWRYYAFLGHKNGQVDIVVVDLGERKIISTLKDIGEGAADWVSMTPKGAWVAVQWMDDRGTAIHERATMRMLGRAMCGHPHCDFVIDKDGNETLVYHAQDGNQLNETGKPNTPNGAPIASVRIFDGQRKILLGDTNDANWTPIITGAFVGWWFTSHFSGIASRAHPGWVLVSTYCEVGDAQNPFAREIFWLKTDGSGEVRHVAHHHSDQAMMPDGKKDYFAEPHATSSWDGSVVVFSSCWGQPGRYAAYTAKGVTL